jgi:hypothetical protein
VRGGSGGRLLHRLRQRAHGARRHSGRVVLELAAGGIELEHGAGPEHLVQLERAQQLQQLQLA